MARSDSSVLGDRNVSTITIADLHGRQASKESCVLPERPRFGTPSPTQILPAASAQYYDLRMKLYRVIMHPTFDVAVGIIIVANSACVGIEQTYRLNEPGSEVLNVFGLLENVFLVAYVLEFMIRVFACGFKCLWCSWVQFDGFLVVIGIASVALEYAIGELDGLAPLMVLRVFRLLRLARTVRLIVKFRVLWMLVRGLLTSASTMFYTLILMVIIMYIYSCVGMELITANNLAVGDNYDPEFKAVVDEYFDSIPTTMLTMLQFVCLDSVGVIYRPLIAKQWYLMIYFAAIILTVPVVLMNLVTAILVEGSLDHAAQDKDAVAAYEAQKRRRLVKDLRKLFIRLDEDKSGSVSEHEILMVTEEDMKILKELTSISDPLEIFQALDLDGSGEVDIDEFCDGIWQVVVSKAPVEVRRIGKQTTDIHQRVRDLHKTQDYIVNMMENVCLKQKETTVASHKRNPWTGDTGSAVHKKASVMHQDCRCHHDTGALPADTPMWAKLMFDEFRNLQREVVLLRSEHFPSLSVHVEPPKHAEPQKLADPFDCAACVVADGGLDAKATMKPMPPVSDVEWATGPHDRAARTPADDDADAQSTVAEVMPSVLESPVDIALLYGVEGGQCWQSEDDYFLDAFQTNKPLVLSSRPPPSSQLSAPSTPLSCSPLLESIRASPPKAMVHGHDPAAFRPRAPHAPFCTLLPPPTPPLQNASASGQRGSMNLSAPGF